MTVEHREIDREVSWVLKGKMYEKQTIITERVPVHEVSTCDWCGTPLFESRSDAKTCSDRCRIAMSRRNRAKNGNG